MTVYPDGEKEAYCPVSGGITSWLVWTQPELVCSE